MDFGNQILANVSLRQQQRRQQQQYNRQIHLQHSLEVRIIEIWLIHQPLLQSGMVSRISHVAHLLMTLSLLFF